MVLVLKLKKIESQPVYQTLSTEKAIVSPKFSLSYDWRPQVQWFLKSGIGFHSNDTRVVTARQGEEILPPAYGMDAGANLKAADRLLLQVAAWFLYLKQEFVYVGDEAIVEPSGRTRRLGLDFSARAQFSDHLYADLDINYAQGRSLDEPEGANAIPLAPRLTSSGGLTFNQEKGLSAFVRYRYVQKRPANAEGSVTALGYFILDGGVTYALPRWTLSLQGQNLLNSNWNEAQFDTESRLPWENEPVSELHFTPGSPFFWKLGLAWNIGRK
ncbi:MAG: TonB-dependent receptor domain-containing protein [Haliscomenobacter sp.]